MEVIPYLKRIVEAKAGPSSIYTDNRVASHTAIAVYRLNLWVLPLRYLLGTTFIGPFLNVCMVAHQK